MMNTGQIPMTSEPLALSTCLFCATLRATPASAFDAKTS